MAELHVSRKNIQELLSGRSLSGKSFIVPDYQRPYKWDLEKCDTLWNDIVEFYRSQSSDSDGEYFLGTIVTCQNNDGNLEIIDGQQRLTSFLLLLRAFYTSLDKSMATTKNKKIIENLMAKIAPCIWRNVDLLTSEVKDFSDVRLISNVATDNDKHEFLEILMTGDVNDNKKSLYSLNYKFFRTQCNEYAQNSPTDWEYLCLTIINKCIILPIECNDLDSALTIFSTLNDRGMPLSDADIFKAYIYKSKGNDTEKNNFVEQWKQLVELTESCGLSINDIFRYYSHILRAKDGSSEKEIGLRRFYMDDKGKKLTEDVDLLDKLIRLTRFWKDVYKGKGNSIFFNENGRKWIQCLSLYPNDFWKYISSVFVYKNFLLDNLDEESENKDTNNIEAQEKLESFLSKITAFLYSKFIVRPTVSAIKDDIYRNCIHVMSKELNLSIEQPKDIDYEQISQSRITKGLLLLNLYLYDREQELLDNDIEIEHIFPKKWQNTNYNGWCRADAELYLEKIGNKILFEKRLNIQAGNGYFNNKKIKYKSSKVNEVVKYLSQNPNIEWQKSDIEKREREIINRINGFFKENGAVVI